ncbi:MAG TPA: glycosyltransferase 87 family protein [Streptosporangiaceae bacterium]
MTQAGTHVVAGQEAGGHTGRGGVLLAAGAAVFAIALGGYLAAIATHPASDMLKGFDLGVYLQGGQLARHSPATLYTWHQPGHPGIQFTYTPFAAMVFAALSFVSLRALEDASVAVSLAALLATLWIAFRELGVAERARRAGATLLLAGVCLWLEPVQRALYLGQVELVLMALIVWDMCQPPERRPWKGAGVGLAAAIKLVPLIFIAYLIITRRLRAAAVALAVFVVTIVAGFAALPHASVQWWLHANFLQASRTGFVGVISNQSLRGILTRLIGSVASGQPPWIVVGVVAGAAGLAAAMLLHQRGFQFEGLMTCALTALLISPISWDHHWVWVAPFLAVLTVHGVRARDGLARMAWFGGAAVAAIVFGGWPRFWDGGAGLLQGGLIWYAPSTSWAHGDNPGYAEYHWHGMQLLAGNLYLLAGCLLFGVPLVAGVRAYLRTNS